MLLNRWVFDSASEELPKPPENVEHPGSTYYPYELFKQRVNIDGRPVDFYAPANQTQNTKAPVIIFGHGQAMDSSYYELLFEHLAKKGFAVISPEYSKNFFDMDWKRMGADYANLSLKAMAQFSNYVDATKVIFSGHSKGGYVALMAAGIPQNEMKLAPSAVLVFAPAGYDAARIKNLSYEMPVTIVYGESDTVIKPDLIQKIYSSLPSKYKQLITVRDYATSPALEADHYFVQTKKFLTGGRDGLSPFHYYGAAKWLVGTAQDLSAKTPITNPYVYGDETSSKGLNGLTDKVDRSW